MSDELRAAAEMAVKFYLESPQHIRDRQQCFALGRLGELVLSDLARREREAAERALPVTEEWLRSVGFECNNGSDFLENGCVSLCEFDGRKDEWCFYFEGCCVPDPLRRGHVLDMLSAMGIGKGGA